MSLLFFSAVEKRWQTHSAFRSFMYEWFYKSLSESVRPKTLWTPYLKNQFEGLSPSFVTDLFGFIDVLVSFWSLKGQSSRLRQAGSDPKTGWIRYLCNYWSWFYHSWVTYVLRPRDVLSRFSGQKVKVTADRGINFPSSLFTCMLYVWKITMSIHCYSGHMHFDTIQTWLETIVQWSNTFQLSWLSFSWLKLFKMLSSKCGSLSVC